MATTFTSLRSRVARSTSRPMRPNPACTQPAQGPQSDAVGKGAAVGTCLLDDGMLVELQQRLERPRSALIRLTETDSVSLQLRHMLPLQPPPGTPTVDADLDLISCAHHDSCAPGGAGSRQLGRGGEQGHGGAVVFCASARRCSQRTSNVWAVHRRPCAFGGALCQLLSSPMQSPSQVQTAEQGTESKM